MTSFAPAAVIVDDTLNAIAAAYNTTKITTSTSTIVSIPIVSRKISSPGCLDRIKFTYFSCCRVKVLLFSCRDIFLNF